MNHFLFVAVPLALAGVASAATAADSMSPHKVVDTATTQWGPGPAALPPGAKAALLYGDPTKAELFVLRLRFPKGYRIAPHSHPNPEILTIISGGLQLGMGTNAAKAGTRRLRTGSFTAMAPGVPHYASTNEETVIQISTTGPWAVNYVNPADDPRNKRK